MSFKFKLPDIGEGVVEGEIVSWFVKEGDSVEEDQPLVEIMAMLLVFKRMNRFFTFLPRLTWKV